VPSVPPTEATYVLDGKGTVEVSLRESRFKLPN
jgi:hypothetical protein